jgi:putative aldouronate transport system permease protein
MTLKTLPTLPPSTEKFEFRKMLRSMWRQRWMYFLMAPTLVYFAIFKYGPLWNAQIAFKDFKPLLGVIGSPWVGFKHFETFINSFYFTDLMTNTIIFSVAKLVLGLPLAVICAIALHETWLVKYRTFVQTMIYLPHFLS